MSQRAAVEALPAAIIQVSELHLDVEGRYVDPDALICRGDGVLAIALLYVSDADLFVVVTPRTNTSGNKKRVDANVAIVPSAQEAVAHVTKEINEWFGSNGSGVVCTPQDAMRQASHGTFDSGYIMLPRDDDDFRQAALSRALAAGQQVFASRIADYVRQYVLWEEFALQKRFPWAKRSSNSLA